MPFYIRKALSVGPLRFNLSKSGIGISAGIRGLRLGSGAKGNYVHLGREGLYYRQTLPGTVVPTATLFESSPTTPVVDKTALETPRSFAAIESADAHRMVGTSSRQLVSDLDEKRRRTDSWPAVAIGAFAIAGGSFFLGAPIWLSCLIFAVGLAATFWQFERDKADRYAVVMYDMDSDAEVRLKKFHDIFEELMLSGRIWLIEGVRDVADTRYSGGAVSEVRRDPITLQIGSGPKELVTNVPVPRIPAGKQVLHFLPDRLLIETSTGFGGISYKDITLDVKEVSFVEESAPPSDAKIIGSTWKYVNKSGEADRRFKDNREVPIVLYEFVRLQSASGLNEAFHFSKLGCGARLRDCLFELAHTSGELSPT